MRQIFTTIRECVGNGCHIMGCGAHIGIGTGYVDSRRTGIDIHNYWPHICMCTKSFGVQYACNRKVYQNDVDYRIVRGYGTSKESYPNVLNPAWNALKDSKSISWCAGNIFNLNEAKTWCALVLAAGSSIFLGDRLSMLNDSGRDLVRRVVKHADFEIAVPSDLTSADAYTEWRAPQSGRIYVINWTEKEKAISVEADGSYIDIMTDKIYNSNEGKIEIFLESHEGVALKKA
ncbi:MAG: hypothetical protein GX633_03365 [Clostridiales bacterium]|nr:hypothetical protein [Clostridiales bacterium]